MSKILRLARVAPKLCGAKNAERYGRVAELIYKDELVDQVSVFARNDEDLVDPYHRIEPAFAWAAAKGKEDKKQYIMDLVVYAMQKHYEVDHGENDLDLLAIEVDLAEREKLNPDVAEIMPVASVRGTWL